MQLFLCLWHKRKKVKNFMSLANHYTVRVEVYLRRPHKLIEARTWDITVGLVVLSACIENVERGQTTEYNPKSLYAW